MVGIIGPWIIGLSDDVSQYKRGEEEGGGSVLQMVGSFKMVGVEEEERVIAGEGVDGNSYDEDDNDDDDGDDIG